MRCSVGFSLAATIFLLSHSLASAQTKMEKGAELFNEYGCAGCHIFGHDWTAPDLTNVARYWEKDKLIDYIKNTQNHYADPIVRAMAEKYVRYMGNHDVTAEEAEYIYEYLRAVAPR